MGIWNAFKDQVGKDAGRAISNLVWKDKHASVYRRTGSTSCNSKNPIEQNAEENDYDFDRLMQFAEIDIPDDKRSMLNMLSQLVTLLKATHFKDSADARNKANNTYADAILTKYEHVFKTYSMQYPNDTMLPYYATVLKSAKRARFFRKNLTWLIVLCIFVFFIIVAMING